MIQGIDERFVKTWDYIGSSVSYEIETAMRLGQSPWFPLMSIFGFMHEPVVWDKINA